MLLILEFCHGILVFFLQDEMKNGDMYTGYLFVVACTRYLRKSIRPLPNQKYRVKWMNTFGEILYTSVSSRD